MLAPGATLGTPEGQVAAGKAGADVVISANFCPDFCKPDYAFFSSSKRYDKIDSLPCPAVLTSNLRTDNPLTVNYDRLCAADAPASNSVLMLLRLLRLCGASQAMLAGADGYREGQNAYAEGRLHTHTDRGAAYNAQVASALRAIQAGGLPIEFVTPSEYAPLMNA